MGERDRQPPARNRAAICAAPEKPHFSGALKNLNPQAHPKLPSSLMKIAALDALILGGLRVFVLIAGYA